MLPDRVSNPGPLTYESGALPIALRGPACIRLRDSTTRMMLQGQMLYPYDCNCCIAESSAFDIMI